MFRDSWWIFQIDRKDLSELQEKQRDQLTNQTLFEILILFFSKPLKPEEQIKAFSFLGFYVVSWRLCSEKKDNKKYLNTADII